MNRVAPVALAVAALALPAGAFAAKTPAPKVGAACASTTAKDKAAHLECVKRHLASTATRPKAHPKAKATMHPKAKAHAKAKTKAKTHGKTKAKK